MKTNNSPNHAAALVQPPELTRSVLPEHLPTGLLMNSVVTAEITPNPTLEAMTSQFEAIGQRVPEMVAERERVEKGAREIIDTFQVRPEFFDDGNRSLLFFSLALSAAKVAESVEKGEVGERRELLDRQAFVTNASFLLTRNFADAYPDQRADHESQLTEGKGGVGDALKPKLDKYVQPEVTRDLIEYEAEKHIFEQVRARMGMREGDLVNPVRLNVLAIGPSHLALMDSSANGLDYYTWKDWDRGLTARTARFVEEIPNGKLASTATGFAVREDGSGISEIYMPMASVEAMMADKRGIVTTEYAEKNNQVGKTEATLQHEYVHTQGNLKVEGEFGTSLEERRAEHFSGDKSEYFEVKSFFRQMAILYGSDIREMFEEVAHAHHEGSKLSIYEELANRFGLEKVAEIAAAQPDAYVRHAASQYVRDMLQPLGGYNAIIERAGNDPGVDRDAAIKRLSDLVNTLRYNYRDGNIDPQYEELISNNYQAVFSTLNISPQDIPYADPTKR